MTGSRKKTTERQAILEAMKILPPGGYYEWDGKDETDRPLIREEMQAGAEEYRKRAGRPTGSGNKEQVAIRIDRDILTAFRATGSGWQTRMNDALRDWLKSHSPASPG